MIRRICILTPEVVLLKWDIDKPYGVGLLVGARFLRIIVMFTTLELFSSGICGDSRSSSWQFDVASISFQGKVRCCVRPLLLLRLLST